MSEFAEWFERQHGKRDRHMHGTDEELRGIVIAGEYAADELRRREIWDEKRQAALYAWQASRKGEA